MKQKVCYFDEVLFKRCKRELSKKPVKEIVLYYQKKCNLNRAYKLDFLNQYYSPILTALKQFFSTVKNKRILEIGYRLPIFLDYLEKQGAVVYGIDTEPSVRDKNLLKMSVENITPTFFEEHKNKFDAIIARITLSRLYNENHFLETGEYRFRDKEKILSNLYHLLKPDGILVLQDDRETIFTEAQFAKAGFKKIMKETPIIFKDRQGKNLGWNVLVVYQKSHSKQLTNPREH